METIFHTLSFSETTEFVNSSAEDRNYAKLFWKSINSPSIMESKLNPKDANQLLKPAGPSERKNALVFPSAEELKRTSLYIEKVQQLEAQDRLMSLEQRKSKIEQIRKNVSQAKVAFDQKKIQTQESKKSVPAQSAHGLSQIATTNEGASRGATTAATRTDPLKFDQPISDQPLYKLTSSPKLRNAEDKLECEVGFNDVDDVRNLP